MPGVFSPSKSQQLKFLFLYRAVIFKEMKKMKSKCESESSHLVSFHGSESAESVVPQARFPPPICICKRSCIVYISKTSKNPNRAFYGCPYFKEKKPFCGFFFWVDEYEKEMLEAQQGKVVQLERDTIGIVAQMEMDMEGKIAQLERDMKGKIAQMERDMEVIRIHMDEMQVKMKGIMNWQGFVGVIIVAMVFYHCIWK